MEEDKRNEEEMAVESKAFLDALCEDAKRRNIPPDLVVSLFGFFAKSLIDMRVDQGEERAAATFQTVDSFMQGLGMKTVYQGDADEPHELH
jgi:hypothetical protein